MKGAVNKENPRVVAYKSEVREVCNYNNGYWERKTQVKKG